MSLFISLAGVLIAFALNATPAMALSLNPDAASPGIDDANALHSILFVVIVAVIVLVNLAILNAARPRTRHVPPGSGQKRVSTRVVVISGIFSFVLFLAAIGTQKLAVILVALVVILGLNLILVKSSGPRAGSGRVSQTGIAATLAAVALILFVVATIFSDKSREIPAVNAEPVAGQIKGEPLEIVATGSQWLWRFNYPNGAFSYRRLTVPAGVTVQLDLVSTDVVHGWNLPELTGKAQAIPGKTNKVYFRADDPGDYTSRSSVLSGQGYDTMQIEVNVVSPQEYEATIDVLKKDIQDAQDTVEAQFQAERKKSESAASQASKAASNNNAESAKAE